jgi:acyl-CoA reductase-like NAD-dependent aldehyde dehydrogenase
VESKIYDDFVQRAKVHAEGRVLGNPFDIKTQQGPQVDEAQYNTIMKYIGIGKSEKAQLVTGGERFGNKGYFVKPTVFANVDNCMQIAREEVVFNFLKLT